MRLKKVAAATLISVMVTYNDDNGVKINPFVCSETLRASPNPGTLSTNWTHKVPAQCRPSIAEDLPVAARAF